jgi:hypothetical protein
MKPIVTKRETFGLRCGCHLQTTDRARTWQPCYLHDAASEMLKALEKVLSEGGGVSLNTLVRCGAAVNEAKNDYGWAGSSNPKRAERGRNARRSVDCAIHGLQKRK